MIQPDNRIRADQSDRDSRSFTELLKELRDETITLLRQEVNLAKTEASEKISVAGRNAASLAVGGVIAFAGFLVLLMSATVGLYVGLVAAGMSHATAGWVAPLVIGAVVTMVGTTMIQKAVHTFKHESFDLERTKASVAADKQWITEKVS
jgi:xanthine/uracil permease